jgi:hypothetical protein
LHRIPILEWKRNYDWLIGRGLEMETQLEMAGYVYLSVAFIMFFVIIGKSYWDEFKKREAIKKKQALNKVVKKNV